MEKIKLCLLCRISLIINILKIREEDDHRESCSVCCDVFFLSTCKCLLEIGVVETRERERESVHVHMYM